MTDSRTPQANDDGQEPELDPEIEALLDFEPVPRRFKKADGWTAPAGAMRLFAFVAAGEEINSHAFFIADADLHSEICKHLSRITQDAGSEALSGLVQSIPDDDLFLPLSQVVMFAGAHPGSGEKYLEPIFATLSKRWLHFGPPALSEYSRLITDQPDDEPAFQSFFERCPQFLDPLAQRVWSKPNLAGRYEPDFVIARFDGTYLIVEIEKPAKSILTSAGQPSATATQALQQVLDYREFLADRVALARSEFAGYRDPDGLVVIGLESALSANSKEALKRVNSAQMRTRIVGFDWVMRRAEATLQNIGSKSIEVLTGARLY